MRGLFWRRVAAEAFDQSSAFVERGVPDQFRRVVVGVAVHNVDERERLVGAAQRHAELVDDGPVLVFANGLDVGVPHGAVVEPFQQRDRGPPGDVRVMTTPAAAKAPTCARYFLQLHSLTCTRLLAWACARPTVDNMIT